MFTACQSNNVNTTFLTYWRCFKKCGLRHTCQQRSSSSHQHSHSLTINAPEVQLPHSHIVSLTSYPEIYRSFLENLCVFKCSPEHFYKMSGLQWMYENHFSVSSCSIAYIITKACCFQTLCDLSLFSRLTSQ